jgi:plasmid stabilization system protein ParE
MEKTIVWTETALNQLETIYFYILESSKSVSIADKVIQNIMDAVSILNKNSEIYETDEMKYSKDDNFRAFEIYKYRISYKITSDTIYILRVRLTSRNQKFYS